MSIKINQQQRERFTVNVVTTLIQVTPLPRSLLGSHCQMVIFVTVHISYIFNQKHNRSIGLIWWCLWIMKKHLFPTKTVVHTVREETPWRNLFILVHRTPGGLGPEKAESVKAISLQTQTQSMRHCSQPRFCSSTTWLQKQDSPKLSEETYGKFLSFPQQTSWRGVVQLISHLIGEYTPKVRPSLAATTENHWARRAHC